MWKLSGLIRDSGDVVVAVMVVTAVVLVVVVKLVDGGKG